VKLPPFLATFAPRAKPILARLKRRTKTLKYRRIKRQIHTWRRPLAAIAFLVILAAGPGIYFYLNNPNRAQAAWFDTNWGFRQKIPLTNTGSAQTDFQVQVTIDTSTLITAGKLQSSCQDMRFTSITGKSLPYWIEPTTCNTTTTKAWVKVDSIATATSGTATDIYFYYGNASASDASSTTKTFISDQAGAAVNWPLDDTTATQSYSRVVNPAVSTGKDIVINGGFGADTDWTKGTGWTIAGGVAHNDGTGIPANLDQALPLIIGKAYTVTYTVSNYVSGSVKVFMGISGSGSARTGNGTFTETIVAAGTSRVYLQTNGVNGFVGDIDNITVQQLGIPPSSGTTTNLLTDGNMETAGTAAWTAGGTATLSKQTTSPHGGTNLLRITRNGGTPTYAAQTVMTIGNVYRVSGYIRSDGSATPQLFNGSTSLFGGTTSTSWQPFDVLFVATATDIRLQTNSVTNGQYIEFDDVVVSNDTTIRTGELAQDSDMEASGTGVWTALQGATLSKQTTSPHGGTQVLRVASTGTGNPTGAQAILTVGKTYRFTGWTRSDGTALPRASNVAAQIFLGTTSTSWQFVDVTFLAVASATDIRIGTSSSVNGQYAEWDDISITEVDPLVGAPTNGVTLGSAVGASGHLTTGYTFDGTNDLVNIYSSDLNSVFNATEGSVVAWAKVSGSGVWSDGTTRYVMDLEFNGLNRIWMRKSNVSNQFLINYSAGSTDSLTTVSSISTTGWFQVAITWNKSSDQVKAYFNGVQTGTTLTGLGTWSGNLTSTSTVIGASTSTGTSPWSGMINDVRLYTRALSATEIAAQYNASTDIQAYTTSNYMGRELLRKYSDAVVVGSAATEEVGTAPTAYWKFSEGTGTSAKDSSSNSNTGTLGGTTVPTWQTEDQCVTDKCLYFDGATSKVTGSRIMKGVKTIGFWIRPNNIGTQGLFNLDGGTHKISTTIAGVVTATGFTSPTYYVNGYATTTPTLTIGQWNYVEITTATGFDSTSSFTIGTDGTNFYGGYMDEVRVYAYARSAAQVKVDFTGTASRMGSNWQQGLNPAGLVAAWGLQDTTTTQSYSAVVNPGVGTGRNIAVDGDMESSATTSWPGNGPATVTKDTTSPHSGTRNLRVAYSSSTNPNVFQTNLVSGKIYQITGWYRGDGGTTTPKVAMLSNTQISLGTSSNSWQQFTVTFKSDSTSLVLMGVTSSAGYAEFDDVVLTQINIPASTATQPTQVLVDGDAETSGTAAWTTVIAGTITKDTTSPHGGTQNLRIARSVNNNPIYKQTTALTTGRVYRVTGFARSDGSAIPNILSSTGNTNIFTGTTSTAWQPIDAVFVADGPQFQIRVNTSTGTQYAEFDDLIVSEDNYIRPGDLSQDGNMEASGITYWVAQNSATVTKQTTSPHGGSQVLRVARNGVNNPQARQVITPLGKTFRITGYARSDGSATPRVLDALGAGLWIGTTSTSWQAIDATFILTASAGIDLRASTSTGTEYVEFDDISITEVSPLVGLPTNSVVLGSSANGHLSNAYTFDGTNDNVNIYSSDLNSVFNPNEGTLIAWAKVAGAGVWTDGVGREIARILVDNNNFIILRRSTTSNTLEAFYSAGGSSKTVSSSALGATTNWFQVILTWSKSNDQVKVYLNGSQVGSTQTGLGTWVGNIISTQTTIGAQTSSGANPWSGQINDVKLFNRALSPSEISTLYGAAPGPVGYWKLDEKTGTTAADSSGNANTGTLTNGPTWTTGKYGSSTNFDGSDDYIDLGSPTSFNFGSNNFTYAAWIRYTGSGTAARIIAQDDNSTNTRTIALDGSNHAIFQCRDASNNSMAATGTTTLNDSNWHYIVGVRNGTTGSIYVDGVLQASTTNASVGSCDVSVSTKIGGRVVSSTPGLIFTGQIDDAKIYNYARSAAQITEDMRGSVLGTNGVVSSVGGTGSTTKPASALGYWKFDEGQGTTANNAGSGGSTFNGTLTNMAAPATSTSGWNNSGKVNKALTFDGTDDFVSIPDNDALDFGSTDFTISTWAKVTAANFSASQSILVKGTSSASYAYALFYDNNGTSTTSTISFRINNNAVLFSSSAGAGVVGQWQHIVISRVGSTFTLYVDGKAVGTTTSATAITANSNVLSIAGTATGLAASGHIVIDELKVFPFGFTPDQVKADYNQGLALNSGVGATTEAAADLTSGAGVSPVGEWNFEERTGTTTSDASGNNNIGTLTNGPTWTTGKYGSAVQFDGTNDYISIADSSSLSPGAGNYTVSAWVKTTANPGTNPVIFRNTGNGSGTVQLAFVAGTGKMQCFYRDDSGNSINITTLGSALNDGSWHYVSCVRSGTSAIAYVDGIQIGSSTNVSLGTITTTGSGKYIGSIDTSSQLWNGSIDRVQIYNYARSADQIAYDYNRGAPVGWWKMDECQGTTVNDASGFGNSGTLTVGASGTQTLAGTCNTASTAWGNGASGKVNSSLNFDGTNDYVSTAAFSPFAAAGTQTSTLSWGGWFYSSTFASTTLMEKATEFSITTGAGGGPSCKLYTSGLFRTVAASTINLPTNTWNHVMCTQNGTTGKIYINGNLVASGTNGAPVAASSIMYLGRDTGGTQFYTGQIDDIRLFNYTLTAAQVRKLYNNGFSSFYGPSSGAP
jgi:hypothetical protein